MKKTLKEKAFPVFFAITISILGSGFFDADAFDRTICNSNHSALMIACHNQAGNYGWGSGSAKQSFDGGCDQAAVTIVNRCYSETVCGTFRSFLSDLGSSCNSLAHAAKKDGCYEMRTQWINLYDGKNFSPCVQ